jgi:hypothetical protein
MSDPSRIASYAYRFEDPPSNDPRTPRMICRPTVLPIVRAALFTIACTFVSPRREPPEPSTPPSAAPADSNHPSPSIPLKTTRKPTLNNSRRTPSLHLSQPKH